MDRMMGKNYLLAFVVAFCIMQSTFAMKEKEYKIYDIEKAICFYHKNKTQELKTWFVAGPDKVVEDENLVIPYAKILNKMCRHALNCLAQPETFTVLQLHCQMYYNLSNDIEQQRILREYGALRYVIEVIL